MVLCVADLEFDKENMLVGVWPKFDPAFSPASHTQPLHRSPLPPLFPPHACSAPLCACHFMPWTRYASLTLPPLPMSLPLCVKRMQFLSLPQWCSAWSAPRSTWCGATGGATPPRAWTSTTPSTAKPPARARRTRSTSGGRTPWDTMRTTTRTLRASAWESWRREGAPARSSLPCLSGAACQIPGLTGTQSSPCSPLQSDLQTGGNSWKRWPLKAHAHTVRSEVTWTEFAEGMNNVSSSVTCSHSQPYPMPVPIWKPPVRQTGLLKK